MDKSLLRLVFILFFCLLFDKIYEYTSTLQERFTNKDLYLP